MEYITAELKGVIGKQYAAPQGRILMNPFADVKASSWFGKYVIDLYNDGIINGTSATTYAPNNTLTWAAALKLLLVSNGDLKAADATGADWSKNAIAKAAELGLVAADLDGAKAISRLEFCQVAAKLNKLAESKTESKFTDCTDGYVMALVDAKVISGMTETTFEPAASLTRAQIAKIPLSAHPDREVRQNINAKERCLGSALFAYNTGRGAGASHRLLIFRFAYR
ncbi:MAG: S-layer homology domain-containing protein [Oscillibacter sp.]